MRAGRVELRSFRNLDDGEVMLAEGTTVVHGPNGAGKTNLLEALYFGLAGRSCRTSRDREAIAFDAELARVEVDVLDSRLAAPGGKELAAAFLASISRDGSRRHLLDGHPASPGEAAARRPPIAVFMPDRLALVKGPPGARRAHLDRLLVALWPARASIRAEYSRVLAQRNALLGRVRAGEAADDALDTWDRELAFAAVALRAARSDSVALLAEPFADATAALGLEGAATLRYAPRAPVGDVEELTAGLAERRSSDLARGFTTAGPHRDELELSMEGRSLRRYGSQGQQRLALLALLFAEREALVAAGRPTPLMLLDDVMSELDSKRRLLLADRLAGEGQALITTTEADQVPGDRRSLIAVDGGRIEAAAVDT
jgi:DNA replication and repair protein RecF